MEKTEKNEIKTKLKGIIAKNLDANIDIKDIDENVSLYEDGLGLDSITIVNLIVQIENTFNFTFESDEINSGLFKNINTLSDYIFSKTQRVKELK